MRKNTPNYLKHRETLADFERLCDLVHARKNGLSWMGFCPVHEDSTRSLAMNFTDSTILVYCHAGCVQLEVLRKLRSLTSPITLHRSEYRAEDTKSRGPVVCTYDYTDEQNRLLYQVLRYDPKGFSQRRPDGKGGWIYRLDGVRRVLYRLPEVLAAKGQVILTEGEKDAEYARFLGFTATTNAMGAAARWLDEYTDELRGKKIVISPDNDDKGIKHMAEALGSFGDVVESVMVVLPPKPHKDLSDWAPSRKEFIARWAPVVDFGLF